MHRQYYYQKSIRFCESRRRKGVEFTILTFNFFNLQNYFVCKWYYSPDIKSFHFGLALNPGSSIRMNCCDSPWLFAVVGLCFAEDTFFFNQYFISNLVIIVNLFSVFSLIATIGQYLPSISYFVPVTMNGMSKSISRPKIAAPGLAWSTV